MSVTSAGTAFGLAATTTPMAAGLTPRQVRRAHAAVTAACAALVLAGALYVGYETSRPLPDIVTFAFRV